MEEKGIYKGSMMPICYKCPGGKSRTRMKRINR